jgi:hypothetical protein
MRFNSLSAATECVKRSGLGWCADFEDGGDRVRVRVDHRDARVGNEIGSARIVDALIAGIEPAAVSARGDTPDRMLATPTAVFSSRWIAGLLWSSWLLDGVNIIGLL